MMHWWKAVDPGIFKMGSEEYWRNAMFNPAEIPQAREGQQRSNWLTVRDVTPKSWLPFFSGVK
jgi:hypothetical protein